MYTRIKAEIFRDIEKTVANMTGKKGEIPKVMEEPLYDMRNVCVYRQVDIGQTREVILPVGGRTERKYDQSAIAKIVTAGTLESKNTPLVEGRKECDREDKEVREMVKAGLQDDEYDGMREKSFPSKEHLIFMYEESRMMDTEIEEVIREIVTFDRDYQHDDLCFKYHNLEYLCDSVIKIRRRVSHNQKDSTVTIHDLLTFNCFFCGHDNGNRLLGENGKIQKITRHSLFNCHTRCCGAFLDKRKLQYRNGDCMCGREIMRKLRIRPANEEEHSWRQKLYNERRNVRFGKEMKLFFRPIFDRLQIETPAMITWYITAQGEPSFNILQQKTEHYIEDYILTIMVKLNGEFGHHQPIRGEQNKVVGVHIQTTRDLSRVGIDLVLKVKTKFHVKIVFLRVYAELYRVIEKFG